MNSFGIFVDGDTVRFERMLEAPPEHVWEYLTDSELLSQWLGAGEIEPKLGGKVFLRPGGPVIRGIVKRYDPPHALSYSWNVLMLGEETPVTIEAILGFELTDQAGNTSLTLTHGPVESQFLVPTAAGWHAILDILGAYVAEADPPDFMDVYRRVSTEYETAVAGS